MMGVGQTGTLQFQSALCLPTGCPRDRSTAEGPRDICSQLTGVLPPKAYNDKTSMVFGPNFKSFHNAACFWFMYFQQKGYLFINEGHKLCPGKMLSSRQTMRILCTWSIFRKIRLWFLPPIYSDDLIYLRMEKQERYQAEELQHW